MGQQQGFTTGSFGSVQPVSGFTKGYIRGFLYKAGSPAGVWTAAASKGSNNE